MNLMIFSMIVKGSGSILRKIFFLRHTYEANIVDILIDDSDVVLSYESWHDG